MSARRGPLPTDEATSAGADAGWQIHRPLRNRHPSEFILGSALGPYPWAKNWEISSEGIAPPRMMRQREASSLRSMMVEATSRGDAPPSTMMLMRPSSCSRTCSALVHSDAPLRFADVAVMGIAAAVTTARGIFALGTRSATLPVLAVTFSGRREPAFTMMVSGPGQNFRANA